MAVIELSFLIQDSQVLCWVVELQAFITNPYNPLPCVNCPTLLSHKCLTHLSYKCPTYTPLFQLHTICEKNSHNEDRCGSWCQLVFQSMLGREGSDTLPSTYPEQPQIYVQFLLCMHTSQFMRHVVSSLIT